MTVLGRLARSIENPTVPISGANILEFLGGRRTHTGRHVSETGSLAMPAVWRAVNLLASTGASLPLKTYRGEQEPTRVLLMENPHPDLTPMEVSELRLVHLLMWGNSYAQKVRDANNRIVELWPLPPSQVKVGKVQPSAANPSGKVFKLGSDDRAYTRDDILHIPGLGYDGVCGVSPLRMATQAIALGLAAEEYASRLYASGSLMSGILQTEQRLDQTSSDRLKANWKAKVTGLDKAHEIAVLDAGAKFQPVSMPANDAQMIESRRFQIQEVARWFGIPPHMLGDVSGSTSWGTGIEQQSIGFVVYTLRPWLTRIEQRLTREVTPAGVYAKYKVEGLLRGDSAARAAFYNTMRQVGAYSANDIRKHEDEPPIEGGDTYLEPLNMVPLGSSREAPAEADPEPAARRVERDEHGYITRIVEER